MTPEQCPCGSGVTYTTCCQPVLQNPVAAATAESLMRARYTAHVVKNVDFIIQTTHSSTYKAAQKSAIIDWVEGTTWKQLQVLETYQGTANDQEGFVLFKANYEQNGKAETHDEHSFFKREDGQWYFVEGRLPAIKKKPLMRQKVARNAPCPCGSGKKHKRCCA